jgi:aspartokinase-like uncharacterized kinase
VTPAVVKLGGSFCRHPRLREIAASIGEGGGRAVVVPGGGPFADHVRAEQQRIGYDDRAAHRMALLAMAQFGTAVASLSDRLIPATGVEPIRRALAERRVPVWLPLDILDGAPGVTESWDMTSDSLAAWLAARLSAERLIFLKRAPAPRSMVVADLVSDGILDPLAPKILADGEVAAWLCGPRDLGRLGPALASSAPVGRRIALA